MSWNAYEVCIKSISPTLIGDRNLGVIRQTRYYIPGKNVWAMLTAYLTKKNVKGSIHDWKLIDNNARDIDYKIVGKLLRKYVKLTYFFPYDEDTIFSPCYRNSLKLGNKSKEEFENTFISSFASTAINRDSSTALEEGKGSYHEVEFIKRSTYFIGYIFIDDDFKISGERVNKNMLERILREAFKHQGIGGEKNYGFGRFELVELKERNDMFTIFNSKIKVKIKDGGILILPDEDNYTALAHVDYCRAHFTGIKGDFEPLVGMVWSEKGPGRNPSKAVVCLKPGTIFKLLNNEEIFIGDYGIWEGK